MDLLILGAGGNGRVVKEVAEVTGKMQDTEKNTHVPESEMPVADKELSEKYKRDFGTEISFF